MGETEAWRYGERNRSVLVGASAGVLAALALAPPAPALSFLPASVLAIPLWLALALLWSFQRRPAALWASSAWGAAAVLVSHRWLLALHPLDWIGVPLPLSLPLCVLLLLACAALAGLLLALWSAVAVRLGPQRFSAALLLSCGWGLAEVLLARGPLFWIGLGGSALPADPPLAALACLGGSGLVAALQLLIGWGLWRLLVSPLRSRPGGWAWAGLLLLALHGLGWWQLQGGGVVAAARDFPTERVEVLQPAIPTRQKQQWQARQRTERLLGQALNQAQAAGADLVLLPEGALGLEPLLAEPAAVELLSGGFRWQLDQAADGPAAGEPQQRSALLRFAAGERRFSGALDKHRLVPLGEWVPFGGLLRWSGLSAVGGLQPGAPSRLLERPVGPIAAAICYEIADGTGLAAAVREGAGWLLASANLDPYPPLLQRQFTALARLRALETRRWLVSVANTGPSQLIDPAGRVVWSLPVGVPASGVTEVPVLAELTPYGRLGELPLLALALAGLLLHLRARLPSISTMGGRSRPSS